MTARRDNWRAALSAYLTQMRATGFVYGKSDCACFAAGAVEAMTGIDPMAEIRGYASIAGAHGALKQTGARDLADLLARSFAEIHPSEARYGDLGLFETDGPFGYAIGVVTGERVMAMSENGLDSLDRAGMARAFQV